MQAFLLLLVNLSLKQSVLFSKSSLSTRYTNIYEGVKDALKNPPA
jgi:hypothetical protein